MQKKKVMRMNVGFFIIFKIAGPCPLYTSFRVCRPHLLALSSLKVNVAVTFTTLGRSPKLPHPVSLCRFGHADVTERSCWNHHIWIHAVNIYTEQTLSARSPEGDQTRQVFNLWFDGYTERGSFTWTFKGGHVSIFLIYVLIRWYCSSWWCPINFSNVTWNIEILFKHRSFLKMNRNV